MKDRRYAITGVRSFLVLAGFQSRQLLRTSFFVQLAVTAPLSFGLLRALGSLGAQGSPPHSLWFETAIAGMWATTTTAVGIIGFQRFQGTLEFLAASTLAPRAVFASLASAAALIGWVGIPIGIALQIVLSGGITMHSVQFLALLVSTTACIASACVLAALFVLTRRANAFEPLILVPVWLLSGVVIPLGTLPQWLWPVALLHPLTSAVEAGRQADLNAGLCWVAVSLVVSVAWLFLAKLALGAALKRARVAGTLSLS